MSKDPFKLLGKIGYDSSEFSFLRCFTNGAPLKKNVAYSSEDLGLYSALGNATGAKKSSNYKIRFQYYVSHPKDRDAKKDRSKYIRRLYYCRFKDDMDGKKDQEFEVRAVCYANEGWCDPNAAEDAWSPIRMMYHATASFSDPAAAADPDENIRYAYFAYHDLPEAAKHDEDKDIREAYYRYHKALRSLDCKQDTNLSHLYYKAVGWKDTDWLLKENKSYLFRLGFHSSAACKVLASLSQDDLVESVATAVTNQALGGSRDFLQIVAEKALPLLDTPHLQSLMLQVAENKRFESIVAGKLGSVKEEECC